MQQLTLVLLDGRFAVCKLDPDDAIPVWALQGKFYSVTRSDTELSLICHQQNVPANITCEREWRCIKVDGIFDLSMSGVLESLVSLLSAARISVLAVSTFETDYVLVKEADLGRTRKTLANAGHKIIY